MPKEPQLLQRPLLVQPRPLWRPAVKHYRLTVPFDEIEITALNTVYWTLWKTWSPVLPLAEHTILTFLSRPALELEWRGKDLSTWINGEGFGGGGMEAQVQVVGTLQIETEAEVQETLDEIWCEILAKDNGFTTENWPPEVTDLPPAVSFFRDEELDEMDLAALQADALKRARLGIEVVGNEAFVDSVSGRLPAGSLELLLL